MVARILVTLGLIVLGGGFIFFAANVIWLGTKEFFKVYGPKSKKPEATAIPAASAPATPAAASVATTSTPTVP